MCIGSEPFFFTGCCYLSSEIELSCITDVPNLSLCGNCCIFHSSLKTYWLVWRICGIQPLRHMPESSFRSGLCFNAFQVYWAFRCIGGTFFLQMPSAMLNCNTAATAFLFPAKFNSFSGREQSFPFHNRYQSGSQRTLPEESNILMLSMEIKLLFHIQGECFNNWSFGYEFLGLRLRPPSFCYLVRETFFSAHCLF